MAMENKRIIQLSAERTNLTSGDYVMVDSETDGSAKYRLDRLKETDSTLSVSGMAADAAATGQAISDEATARSDADTALGNDIDDLKSALNSDIHSLIAPITFTSGKGWNTSNGALIQNSSCASAKVPFSVDYVFHGDTGKLIYYLYWNGDTYLGYTNGYNVTSYPNATHVATYCNGTTVPENVYYASKDLLNVENDVFETKYLSNYVELTTFTTNQQSYDVTVNLPKGLKVLCKYHNKSGTDGYARMRFYNGSTQVNDTMSKLVSGESIDFSSALVLAGNVTKITFTNNNTKDFDVSVVLAFDSITSIAQAMLGNDILLGAKYLQSVTVSGYASTPLTIASGKKYLICITAYTGTSGGSLFRAYKTGGHSISLPFYKPISFIWTADDDYEGFYSASCTYSVFELDNNSIIKLLKPFEYTVGSSDCDFPTFKSAITFAYHTGNVVLRLSAETFEITSETNIANEGNGLAIGNGVHIIGQPGTVISCKYTGGEGTVQRYFSLFMGKPSDFTIENVRIECENVRYCVHDECSGYTAPYVHKYINCDMYHDSSEAHWRSSQCIGGGLGENGICIVEGGIYESALTYYSLTNDLDGPFSETPSASAISWHKNNDNADAVNTIIIKSVYMKGAEANFIYGTGANGKIIITGCSYSKAPEAYSGTNVAYIWGNELRTQ